MGIGELVTTAVIIGRAVEDIDKDGVDNDDNVTGVGESGNPVDKPGCKGFVEIGATTVAEGIAGNIGGVGELYVDTVVCMEPSELDETVTAGSAPTT